MKSKLFIVLLFFFGLSAYAQTIPDFSDDDTITLFNSEFRLHKIKKGESLLAIANASGIDLNTLLKVNTELFDSTIKIIDTSVSVVIPDTNFSIDGFVVGKVFLYTVKKNQTLDDIVNSFKTYGMTTSVEMIKKHNPGISDKPKKNTVIKVPTEFRYRTIEDEYFIYKYIITDFYQVWLLKSIYGLSPEELAKYNKHISEQFKNGLLYKGNFVVIPKNRYTLEQYQKFMALENPKLLNIDPLYFEDEYTPCKKFSYDGQEFNIALLLPFFTNENHLLVTDFNDNAQDVELYKNTEIIYQYYFGMLLALKDLENTDIKIHLKIYDTKNDTNRIKNILAKDQLQNTDLIIGPAYAKNFTAVKSFSEENHVNAVAPFTRKNYILDNNPFFFLANPSDYVLEKKVAQYLANYPDSNVVLILDYKSKTQKLADYFVQQINAAAKQNGTDTFAVKKTYYNQKYQDDIKLLLKKDTLNYVVVPTNDVITAISVLNYLDVLASIEHYRIQVFGMPTWEKFKTIDYKWMTSMKIVFPSAFYLDNTNPKVIEFKNRYYETYHTLPSLYSFMGYDQMLYFASLLKQYGRHFQFCMRDTNENIEDIGVAMDFDFQRKDSLSGFENNAVRLFYYDHELKIKLLEEKKNGE